MDDVIDGLDWNDVVRLRGWRWKNSHPPTANDLDQLIKAWRTEAEATLTDGVMRRELYQASTAASSREGGEPGFLLLEFAILVPEIGSVEHNHRAPEMSLHLEETSGFFRVDARLPGGPAPSGGLVRFDYFRSPQAPGPRQGFLMGWPARVRSRAQSGGAILCERLVSDHDFFAFERSWVGGDGDPADAGHETYRIVASVSHRSRPPRPAMKAVRFHDYGAPSVLRLEETPQPRPGPGQVRVRLRAAAVNRLDVAMRAGEVRQNFPPWFADTPGHDFSGVVEEVGQGVTDRQVGEEIYGATSPLLRRAYAETLVVSSAVVSPKPRTLSFEEAAAAVSVVTTAWAALFGRAPLQAGHRILVHGGSGAVGAYAVQLAKVAGAEVVATASAANHDRVRSLGADRVIDYRTDRFEALAGELDFVLDTQGGDTRERSWSLLKRGGVLVSLLRPAPDERRAADLGLTAFVVFGHPDIGAVLPEITRHFEAEGLAKPMISYVLPLAAAERAHALMEASGSSERIVLTAG